MEIKKTDNVALILILVQIVTCVLYGLLTDYGQESSTNNLSVHNSIEKYYPFFQDVHVMIFVGFGFLMTFLKKYAFSSLGYTFYLSALSIQMSILINGFFHCLFKNKWNTIELDITSLIGGDFCAGAVLITMGALLGRTTIFQMLIIALLEIIFYSLNESIGVEIYQAVDMGGSMYVHMFGAYFGLAISFVLSTCEKPQKSPNNGSNYFSDIFAMIGTLFLWLYWPSFNGALAHGSSQHRVVINTVLSLTNSCLAAFAISKLFRPGHKFNMIDIQNATLAGGVAVGSSADLVIAPYGALIIGMVSGVVSVVGYIHIQPLLESLNIFDTCGVHNLHGIPGIIGALGGVVSSIIANNVVYGNDISDIFAARASGRTALEQGMFQLAATFTTLGISIFGGILTGLVTNFIKKPNEVFCDHDNFNAEESQV